MPRGSRQRYGALGPVPAGRARRPPGRACRVPVRAGRVPVRAGRCSLPGWSRARPGRRRAGPGWPAGPALGACGESTPSGSRRQSAIAARYKAVPIRSTHAAPAEWPPATKSMPAAAQAPTVEAMSEASADLEFAVTSVISAGSSRGVIALRVTPKAFCSTRTPKAAPAAGWPDRCAARPRPCSSTAARGRAACRPG